MNVLFILADDMRWDLLRYMPFMNGYLRRNGVYFPNARHATPICQSARIGFLTGQYGNGALNGVYDNGDGFGGADTNNIGIYLQAQGVETAFIGKAPNLYRQITPRAGWNRWNVISSNEQQPYTAAWTDGQTPGSSAASTEPEVKHGATLVNQFIEDNAANDWFCWWTPTNPHIQGVAPYEQNPMPESVPRYTWKYWYPTLLQNTTGKPSWIASRTNMTHAGQRNMQVYIRQQLRELYDLDVQIARVHAKIVSEGLANDTMIIFSSDNGAFFGEQTNQHQQTASKDEPYDPASRAPMIITGGGLPRGQTNKSPVSPVQDVHATLLDVFNATGVDPDGTSLIDLINTPNLDRATLYFRQGTSGLPNAVGVFTINRKLIRYEEGTGTPAIDFTTNPDDEYEMYYLDSDPDELDNHANKGGAYLTERNRLETILNSML